jgi:hypothetical protein
MLDKIISGGQYGADLGGLKAAKLFHIKTGGMAPKGWRTCRGPNPTLKDYNLVEHHDSTFACRTISNVINSDGTVIFASNTRSPGTVLTIKTCHSSGRPCLVISNKLESSKKIPEKIADWVRVNNIRCLNVAGNRDYQGDYHEQMAIKYLSLAIPLLQMTESFDDK